MKFLLLSIIFLAFLTSADETAAEPAPAEKEASDIFSEFKEVFTNLEADLKADKVKAVEDAKLLLADLQAAIDEKYPEAEQDVADAKQALKDAEKFSQDKGSQVAKDVADTLKKWSKQIDDKSNPAENLAVVEPISTTDSSVSFVIFMFILFGGLLSFLTYLIFIQPNMNVSWPDMKDYVPFGERERLVKSRYESNNGYYQQNDFVAA